MIYTSYFKKIKKLPKNIIPIAICLSITNNYSGLRYTKLAPTRIIFKNYSFSKKDEYAKKIYIKNFKKEILNNLDCNEVVKELYELSNNQDICLICYEEPNEFCHRQIVSKWLNENGYKCSEYEYSK